MAEIKANSLQEETELGLEEGFERLDSIVLAMEHDEMTLEQSFKFFQEGMELIKRCGEQLADVEKQMIVLEEGSLQ